MMMSQKKQSLKENSVLSKLASDRSGNFAILTAVMLPVLIGSAGLAIDVSNMMMAKNRAQAVADSASLAAIASITEDKVSVEKAKEIANDFVKGAFPAVGAGSRASSSVTITPTKKADGSTSYDAKVEVFYTGTTSPLMAVMGFHDYKISVSSGGNGVVGAHTAMSMFLVLDKSGSMQNSTSTKNPTKTSCTRYYMPDPNTLKNQGTKSPCYYYQIEMLKMSVGNLLDKFAESDPDKKYIRTGAVAYDAVAYSPSALNWGGDSTRSYVNALAAANGTASAAAFKNAYNSLVASSESMEHQKKNGSTTPKKFIIFMTDGTNNYVSDNTQTLTYCSLARTAGITVYTVAFNAPDAAKVFLRTCATDGTTFFDATDGDALIQAFDDIARKTSDTTAWIYE